MANPYTNEEISAHAEAQLQIAREVFDEDPFDRSKLSGNQMQDALNIFSSFPDDFRADMYSSYRIRLDEAGPASLEDHEIFLLSFAPRDSGAYGAAMDDQSVLGGQWYEDKVTFGPADKMRQGQPNAMLREMVQVLGASGASSDDLVNYNALQRQAFSIDEPEPISDLSDSAMQWVQRGYLTAGAAMAGLIAAGSVMAVGATPAGAAAGTAAVEGSRRLFTSMQGVSQAVFENRLASDKVINPTWGTRTMDFFTGLSARIGKPASELIINTAARTGIPAVQRAAEFMTPKVVGRGSLLVGSAASLGGGMAVAFLDPEGLKEAQAELAEENVEKDQERAEREAALEVGMDEQDRHSWLGDRMVEFTDRMDEAVGVAAVRTQEATNLELMMTKQAEVPGVPGTTETTAPMTFEDVQAVSLGTMTVDDFGVGDRDEMLSELVLQQMGGVWAVPGEAVPEGFVEYEDITAMETGDIRKMWLPQSPTAQVGSAQTLFQSYRNTLAEELDKPPENPYIRVPEDYMAQTWKPIAASRAGGTLIPGYDQDRPTFSREEADFITKAQTGAPNLYERDAMVAPQYRATDVLDTMASMSPVQVFKFQSLARDAGFYGSGMIPGMPGHMDVTDQEILSVVMGQANVDGDTFWQSLDRMAAVNHEVANQALGSKSTAPVRDPFSVPVHLRSIPGEKTVAEEAKARFEQKMGRAARPDELAAIANELTGYHTTSNQEEIALYLAAYDGDNQGLLSGAQMERIEDPGAATSFDIGEKWANEIDLNKRRETNSQSFSRMLSATMGNRPSVGNLTAAGGVTQIGRQ